MPKPPEVPPASDIEGVRKDQKPIDHPANGDARTRQEARLRTEEEIGRPAANPSTRNGGASHDR